MIPNNEDGLVRLEADNRRLRGVLRAAAEFFTAELEAAALAESHEGPARAQLAAMRAALDETVDALSHNVQGMLLAAVAASPTLMAVAMERLRQIEVEGFGPAHDDAHAKSQMGAAALSYLMTADLQVTHGQPLPACFIPKIWPWERRWWKQTGGHWRNRVKGLALGCAEGDRLKRIEARAAAEKDAAAAKPAEGEVTS